MPLVPDPLAWRHPSASQQSTIGTNQSWAPNLPRGYADPVLFHLAVPLARVQAWVAHPRTPGTGLLRCAPGPQPLRGHDPQPCRARLRRCAQVRRIESPFGLPSPSLWCNPPGGRRGRVCLWGGGAGTLVGKQKRPATEDMCEDVPVFTDITLTPSPPPPRCWAWPYRSSEPSGHSINQTGRSQKKIKTPFRSSHRATQK